MTSHASLTEANSICDVLKIVDSAKRVCTKRWPGDLQGHQKVMTKIVAHYERVILRAQMLGLEESDKVMRGGRFIGWLWEVDGLVREAVEEREREEEDGDSV